MRVLGDKIFPRVCARTPELPIHRSEIPRGHRAQLITQISPGTIYDPLDVVNHASERASTHARIAVHRLPAIGRVGTGGGIDNRDALEYYDLSKCIRRFTAAGADDNALSPRLLAARSPMLSGFAILSRLIGTGGKGRKERRGRVLTSLPESFRAVASRLFSGEYIGIYTRELQRLAVTAAFVQPNQADNISEFNRRYVSSLS